MFAGRTPHDMTTRSAGESNNLKEFLESRLKICSDEYKLLKSNRLFEPVTLDIFGKLYVLAYKTLCFVAVTIHPIRRITKKPIGNV